MRTAPLAAMAAALLASACSGASGDDEGVSAPSLVTPTTSSSSPTTSSSPKSTSTTGTTSPTSSPDSSRSAQPPATTAVPTRRVTVATGIDVPWSLGFLPDGSALMTTRDWAELFQVREGAKPVSLGKVPGVDPGGEGGLLGVAVSPDFEQDHAIYLYFTASNDNRVVRMTFERGEAEDPVPILTGIPKAGNHNGGRIAFGPDGYLYVATGDAGDRPTSQDRDSLGGKILRITPAGKPAPGNPFPGSPLWSYGHRNVQGLGWDSSGRMFASEFGQNTWDELNLIKPGQNYGWPVVEGRAGRQDFVDPLRQWRTDEASPSGIAVTADGTVYMAALRGESLWRIPTRAGVAGEPERLLAGEYGRLRDVVVGPDGRLWVLTNNTSRGSPSSDDDRVLVIPESTLR